MCNHNAVPINNDTNYVHLITFHVALTQYCLIQEIDAQKSMSSAVPINYDNNYVCTSNNILYCMDFYNKKL